MKKSNDQLIFPIIVSAISVLNIFRNFQEFYITSIAVSLIGIVAVILFLLNKKGSSILFYTWIVAQLITYVTNDIAIVTNQLPEISLGINLHGKSSIFSINFAPLFYFIGYRLLVAFNIIGKEILINPIKAGSPLIKSEGEIIEYVNLGKDGKWYKVNSQNSDVIYIKAKEDGERFSRKKSIFAFVKKYDPESKSYKFIDWGKIRLK